MGEGQRREEAKKKEKRGRGEEEGDTRGSIHTSIGCAIDIHVYIDYQHTVTSAIAFRSFVLQTPAVSIPLFSVVKKIFITPGILQNQWDTFLCGVRIFIQPDIIPVASKTRFHQQRKI